MLAPKNEKANGARTSRPRGNRNLDWYVRDRSAADRTTLARRKYLHNENPSLDALGKLTHTNPRAYDIDGGTESRTGTRRGSLRSPPNHDQTNEQTNERTNKRTNERTNERTNVRYRWWDDIANLDATELASLASNRWWDRFTNWDATGLASLASAPRTNERTNERTISLVGRYRELGRDGARFARLRTMNGRTNEQTNERTNERTNATSLVGRSRELGRDGARFARLRTTNERTNENTISLVVQNRAPKAGLWRQ